MVKSRLLQLILASLQEHLDNAELAARVAHQSATDAENIAENKYDTLGLEAAYLAAGQSRRVEELRQALLTWRSLCLRPFDETQGIQLGAWVGLADGRQFFLGPGNAGIKVELDGQAILVISPQAPLGRALLGQLPGERLLLNGAELEIAWVE